MEQINNFIRNVFAGTRAGHPTGMPTPLGATSRSSPAVPTP